MEYYKVLTRKEGRLLSLVWHSPTAMEYVEGSWNFGRNGSGLFVFDDLETAKQYSISKENEIWLVSVENPRPAVDVVSIATLWQSTVNYLVSGQTMTDYLLLVDKYWNNRSEFPNDLLGPAISGTTICDSLLLLTRIK